MILYECLLVHWGTPSGDVWTLESLSKAVKLFPEKCTISFDQKVYIYMIANTQVHVYSAGIQMSSEV